MFEALRYGASVVVSLALWLVAALPLPAAQKQAAPKQPLREVTPEWMIGVRDILLARNSASGSASPLARTKSRLGWEWLARKHGIQADGQLDRKHFRGPKELFDRLDRDGDGILQAGDFDWSEGSTFVRQQALAAALFNRLNQDGDRTIDAREWQEAFTKLAGRKKALTPEDIRLLLHPTRSRSMSPPSRMHRLFGFFSGELGSLEEGPNPGQEAPDFTLKSADTGTKVKLAAYRGKHPVVLIFGNFT